MQAESCKEDGEEQALWKGCEKKEKRRGDRTIYDSFKDWRER